MPDRIDLRTTALLRWAVRLGSLLAMLLGVTVLAGWALALSDPEHATLYLMVAPPTAIGLVLAGLSLIMLQSDWRRAASASALALLLWATTSLMFRVLFHTDPLTAWVLGEHRPMRHGHLIRIAGGTAIAFILFALGMLGMASHWRRRRTVLMATSLPGVTLTGLALVGYAYDVEPRSGAGFYLGMSPHAAVGLFVLFLMSLAIEPERGWLVLLMSGRPSARVSRAQIMLVTTVPLLAGFLLLKGERAGLILPGLAMAAMAISTIAPLVVQILRDGRMLDVLETRRQAAVAAESLLSNELERRVYDRTAKLARSEARLRGFVDNAVEGLALIRLDGNGALWLETVSPSLDEMWGGLTDVDRLPQPASVVLPANVVAELHGHVARCQQLQGPHHYQARRSTNAGSKLFDVILAPIAGDQTGDGQLYAASVRDITDAELREEQLRQSQKMEAVGQLTGGLAHDFNNMLTGISGSLEMIQSRLAQNRTEDIERYLSTAQEAGHRAAALTHRLLAFSRRQTLDPRLVEIDRIVAGMEDLIRRTMGPQVSVVVQPSPSPWASLIDANQFENALLNLCLNARDAMPAGGELTITTANEVVTPESVLADLPAGDYVRVRVADNGVGMSPDLVARAFDPFFTTKPIGQGTGLGLSMIYGFARQSGGRVELNSELGHGTFVDLRLPRQSASEPVVAATPVEPMTEASFGAGRTVLVVDDEPAIRMLVRDILSERGYRTLEAEDGAGGLAVLRSPAVIDLLVTDVGLPNGMNGRQMADAARMLRNGLPVLFITGYAETAVIGDGVLDPGMEVLTKPFTIGRLMDRVDAMAAPTRADAVLR